MQKFKVPEPYKWSDNVSSIAYNPWNDLRKRKDVAALSLKFPWEKIPSKVKAIPENLFSYVCCTKILYTFISS